MLFTIYYMYATVVQWWRLGALRNKINGTLNSNNAILVCTGNTIFDSKRQRSLENLLFHVDDRIGCTVVPKQKINLSQWASFPSDWRLFPIHISDTKIKLKSPTIYLLIQAQLEPYNKHHSEVLQVEYFGDLVAWKANENLEVILKTDSQGLANFVHCFKQNNIDINHDLRLIKVETVDVEGNCTKIKYAKKFLQEQQLKYSFSPVHWKKFVTDVREIYAKIHDSTTPKIKIENGCTKTEEQSSKRVPVSEVKPIKKESKKSIEDKNTLEVTSGEHRRHKTNEHRREKLSEHLRKNKDDHSSKHKTISDVKTFETKETPQREPENTTTDEGKVETDVKKEPTVVRQDAVEKPLENKKENLNKNIEIKIEDTDQQTSTKLETNGIASTSKSIIASVLSGHKSKDKVKKDSTKDKKDGDKNKKDTKDKKRDSSKEKSEKKDTKLSDKSKEKASDKNKEKVADKVKLQTVEKAKEKLPDKNKEKDKSKEKDKVKEKSSKFEIKLGSKDKSKNKVVSESEPGPSAAGENGVKNNGSNTENLNKLCSTEKTTKPPNILVYADSIVAKDNVKSVLQSIINKEKYTVYDFPVNAKNASWDVSTTLVVVCGTVPPLLTSQLLTYLIKGGQLLCLCSDLLYSVLHTFTTAEVREHELVRFSYGEWKRVKMMHHIFCYQASPAKKQFSKDSDHSNQSSNGSSPIAPRTPSAVEIHHNGKDYIIQVQVLGTEETWQTPSLLLATVKDSKGRAIFSQVHLEIDPTQYEDDENKYAALRDSNKARLDILTDILCQHLNIDCLDSDEVNYSPAYFLGRHEMKLDLLNTCENIKNNLLKTEKIDLIFCGKFDDPGLTSESRLPVLIHSCPSNFSTVQYFETLETQEIGRLVLYADLLTTSQAVISKTLKHGFVVIPRQQTSGVGRSNNMWLSPLGSASFSLQLHVPLQSHFGQYIPILQQLVMVAVVSAIKSIPGYKSLEIGIKWPNDLIAYGKIKIGGLVANTVVETSLAIVNLGCGINLYNDNPTTCINSMIQKYNVDHGTNLKPISSEEYFARVFNEIERIYKIVQNGDTDYFFKLYYDYWLHSNAEITITTKENASQNAKITGIDEYGFLKVLLSSGETHSVQPDGNSFDMMRGLIIPKVF